MSSLSSKMLTSLMPVSSVFTNSSPLGADDWTSSTTSLLAASQQPPASSFPTKIIVMKPASSIEESNAGVPMPMALLSWNSDKAANSSCVQLANEHETQLKNLTLVNVLIFVV